MKIASVVIPMGIFNPNTSMWMRVISINRWLHYLSKNFGFEVRLLVFARDSKTQRRILTELNKDKELAEIVSVQLIPSIMASIRRELPDIIITHTEVPTFISTLMKSFVGSNIVFDMHGLRRAEVELECCPQSSIIYNILYKFYNIMDVSVELSALKKSDVVLTVSRCMGEYLKKFFKLDSRKIVYAPNGVDLDFFNSSKVSTDLVFQLRDELGLSEKKVLCYIGGMHKWQGVENFIKAALKVPYNDVAFLIVGGKGSWKKKNIIKLQAVSREKIRLYYALCDVAVLPRPHHLATFVASPTKLSEYAAMGKPILATNVGDAAYLIRKYSAGYVVPSNHPEDLIQGIEYFVNLTDSELKLMGLRARKMAEEEFDWKKIVLRLYRGMISSLHNIV